MLFRFVTTIPRVLNWSVILSLLTLLIKIVLLNRLPESFPGANQLGIVVEGILGSMVASYVFYLVVVHTKEIKDKQATYPFIISWTQRIVEDCRQQLTVLGTAARLPLDLDCLTAEAIDNAFVRIKPHSPVPVFGQQTTCMRLLDDYRARTKRDVARIMSQLIYLDAHLVGLLMKVDDCHHFRVIEELSRLPLNNPNMVPFSEHFFMYCQACRELDQYVKHSGWMNRATTSNR